jgi:hypothetical protein
MKWVLSHATDEIHHWLLQQEEGSRSLTLHLQRLSLRLSGFSKRLFFLQVGGLLQKKISLRSEYGVELGEVVFTEKASPASIILNGQKLFYQAEDGKLVLRDGDKVVLGECEIAQGADLNRTEFYALLFGFAWFVTVDSLAEKTYAAMETS